MRGLLPPASEVDADLRLQEPAAAHRHLDADAGVLAHVLRVHHATDQRHGEVGPVVLVGDRRKAPVAGLRRCGGAAECDALQGDAQCVHAESLSANSAMAG